MTHTRVRSITKDSGKTLASPYNSSLSSIYASYIQTHIVCIYIYVHIYVCIYAHSLQVMGWNEAHSKPQQRVKRDVESEWIYRSIIYTEMASVRGPLSPSLSHPHFTSLLPSSFSLTLSKTTRAIPSRCVYECIELLQPLMPEDCWQLWCALTICWYYSIHLALVYLPTLPYRHPISIFHQLTHREKLA